MRPTADKQYVFLSRNAIGHVLRSSRTYAINDEVATAAQGQVLQREVEGQLAKANERSKEQIRT